jgi:hypothetical protein
MSNSGTYIGELRFDEILYIWTGNFWVEATYDNLKGNVFPYKDHYPFRDKSDLICAEVSDTPPEDPQEGDIWYNTENNRTYVWYIEEDKSSAWINIDNRLKVE